MTQQWEMPECLYHPGVCIQQTVRINTSTPFVSKTTKVYNLKDKFNWVVHCVGNSPNQYTCLVGILAGFREQ